MTQFAHCIAGLFISISAGAAVQGQAPMDANGARQIAQPYQDRGTDRLADNQHDDGSISGSAAWTAIGPFGGDVQDAAVSPSDPNLMLAGLAPGGSSGGRLYRSTDGGANWTVVTGQTTTSVYDIEFASDGAIYIATIDSVRKSTNGGVSFTTLNLGIGLNDQVFDLAIDPNNPQVLWIGIADALGSQPVNVMQSINGGTSWDNRTPPIGGASSCRALAVNPNNSQEIYAGFGGGFGGGQLWVSTNGGLNWVNRSAGLPNTPVNDIVHDGTRVLVCGGQLFGGQNFGLFSSINQGQNWTPLHDGTWPSIVLNDIAIDPANASTVYVVSANQGVFHSVNGGAWSFGVGGSGNLSLNSVRFAPGSSSRIVLGANSTGVLQSTDTGASFQITSTGMTQVNIRGVASNPNNANELAVAFEGLNNGGVYRSTDGGATWSLQAVPATRFSNVGFAPNGALYAISSGPSSVAPEGLYRRNANGTWTGLGPDQGTLFESDLLMVKFSAINPNLILLTGSDFGVAGSEPTIWRTPDAGVQWFKVYEGLGLPNNDATDLDIVSTSSDQIMLASYSELSNGAGGGALRSIDGGLTWLPSNTGLTPAMRGNALSPVAGSPNTFYLADARFGATGGLYRTIDAGQSWTSTGFVQQVNDVVGDPADAQAVYILQSNATVVWRSTDAGATFSPFNTGLTLTGFGNRLVHAPGPPSGLMLASSGGTFVTDLPQECPGDIDGNDNVDVNDLLTVITTWGICPNPNDCPGDLDGNDMVDVNDLLTIITTWGACP